MRRWVIVSAVLVAAGLAVAGSGSSRATRPRAASALHVIPFPGTPDVSPSSQVIFSSLRPAQLSSVRVWGSQSRLHRGRLVALPLGDGTAFYPQRPFASGEVVRVTAVLRSAPGSAPAPATHVMRFSFRVAPPFGASPRAGQARRRGASAAPAGRGRGASPPARRAASAPSQSFYSDPGIHPPIVTFSAHLDPQAGDVFVTAQNPHQPGTMILDPQGRLVWFDPVTRGQPMNLQVQRYQGHPVLTWWVGEFRQWGEDMIVDSHYRTVAVVRGGDGLIADLHDFQITPQGTALIDAYRQTKADLSSVGGPRRGSVLDCVIQELDIRTGQVLWEWHALGHVPLNASHEPLPSGSAPFDYFHLNSIQQLPDGNLVISARNTWSVYEISRSTGEVLWTLGGKDSSFTMGQGTRFEWQHNARLNGHTLSLFDDGAAPQEEPESSAKILRLHLRSGSVSLVHRYTHTPSLLANSAGSAQVLPDGDVFVGWGPEPDFSEYTPDGRQVFNGALAWGTDSYRAFRFPWTGQPATQPALTLSPTSTGVTAYASWNGATQVRQWQVLAGMTPYTMHALGPPYHRTGFETTIALNSRPVYVAVQALSASGRVLGTSETKTDPVP